ILRRLRLRLGLCHLFRLRLWLFFRLGCGVFFFLACSGRGCLSLRGRLRRFWRRLVAFPKFRRDAFRYSRHTPREPVLALTRKLFLLVETEYVELVWIKPP